MYTGIPATWLPHGGAPATDVAFAEFFRDRGIIETRRNDPYLAVFRSARELWLLDVSDTSWITEAGGNAAISSGPRDMSRQWARAIWQHYDPDVDGIAYASSNVPSGRAAALWQLSHDALPRDPAFNHALASPDLRSTVELAAEHLVLELA